MANLTHFDPTRPICHPLRGDSLCILLVNESCVSTFWMSTLFFHVWHGFSTFGLACGPPKLFKWLKPEVRYEPYRSFFLQSERASEPAKGFGILGFPFSSYGFWVLHFVVLDVGIPGLYMSLSLAHSKDILLPEETDFLVSLFIKLGFKTCCLIPWTYM